jgi:hypothetical protein
VNDDTPLHYAAIHDPRAIEPLLSHGAYAGVRTNIDDYITTLEEADPGGHLRAAELLRNFTRS